MQISLKSRERLLSYVNRWKKRLLLDSWAVLVTFMDDIKTNKKDEDTFATMEVNTTYKEGRMEIFPSILDYPTKGQKLTIVHELMHIHLKPVQDILAMAYTKGLITDKRRRQVLETITEDLSKVVWKAYNRNEKTGEFQV